VAFRLSQSRQLISVGKKKERKMIPSENSKLSPGGFSRFSLSLTTFKSISYKHGQQWFGTVSAKG
jgi:hypothetical protein